MIRKSPCQKALHLGTLAVFGRFLSGEFYSRTEAVVAELTSLFRRREDIAPIWVGDTANHSVRGVRVWSLLLIASSSLRDLLSLWAQRPRLEKADAIFLPYPAYANLLLLQLTSIGLPRKPIIVDAFLCLHHTIVHDRGLVASTSIRARLVEWIERRTLAKADYVLIDTVQQRDLLVGQYRLTAEKFIVTPVGIDESVWRPLPSAPLCAEFNVLFWGTFIPLHGVSTIIAAAKILETVCPSIRFTLVGDGQDGEKVATLLHDRSLSNVVWHRELLPATQLYGMVANAHCVLGIFGDSLKSASVVPYKVYQALSANRLLVTRGGPAMDDLVRGEDSSGICLVPPGDPQALSEVLLSLRSNYHRVSKGVANSILYERKLSRGRLREALRLGLCVS